LIQEALDRAGKIGLRPLGIGVGVPGMVNVLEGELVFAPNLSWHHVPLRQVLMKRFNVPVFVENDANAAALGEYYFGVAREVKNFIYLSVGVGLGGGIVLGGKLYRGRNGYAGEVGHMALDPNGSLCGCGRRGCWESLVSPRMVVQNIQTVLRNGRDSTLRELAKDNLANITFDQVIEAAEANDCVALDVLRDVARWLGIGIANLVNIFNPELVVLGGVLARANSILIPVIETTVWENALGQPRETLKIAISAHQSEACTVGAAAIVLDEILRYPFP
jgi:glucokinase-like ROK family protein